MNIHNKIKQAVAELNLNADDKQIHCWIEYLKLLEKWNKVYNMTAIRNFDDMLEKHLFDSLSIAKYIKGSATIDVGTGGGLPGVILSILYPEHKFSLVDSVGKKIMFLKTVKKVLNLQNIALANTRIEKFSGEFDNIISRAFKPIDNFYYLCKHLLTEKNQMLAMKGRDCEEQKLASSLLKIKKHEIKVPFLNAKRNLIIIKRNNI